LLWGNWRNGFWEKLLGEVANLLQSCYELVVYVADLIATQWGSRQLITDFYRLANNCYGETGVMDFGLYPAENQLQCETATTRRGCT